MVFYFGCVGGVWKTEDGGTHWENISDGFFETSPVGAMAISESDPNVLYVGMGESCVGVPRLQWTERADGVYRSTDGGKTWRNVGLRDTQHIARLRVHPCDPDLVYVSVLGPLAEASDGRGVYRSRDGGDNWELVLAGADQAGAFDLCIDARNPRVIYASIWEVKRNSWSSRSGGPDTGLYKTVDGGDTWTALTDNPGLPDGPMGRIAVAASPARGGRVWALIEAENGGLFRSDDGGATWDHLWANPGLGAYDPDNLNNRAHYYNHLFANPQDLETVYVLNPKINRSVDGGRTFTHVTAPHADNHDLWIDPRDPSRMINGNDGGACVTFNGGESWSSIYNQPTSEFYHVTTDTRFPYRVYGTQQDNSAICVPSRSARGAILWSESYLVGSSESGQIVVHPDNPDIVYSGAIGSFPSTGPIMLRYDHGTGEVRIISVWPDGTGLTIPDRKYRFSWDYPIVISSHDSGVLYCAGNVVFRSTDDAASWETISPDLTRNDLSEASEFDPLTDIATFERCTITRFAESVHEPGVFWAGSDDGLVHISRDGGSTWQNVTPDGLPEWAPVSSIDLSAHEPGAAYVSANRFQVGDYRPYLYKTSDYGKTWETIVSGISEHNFARVLREDPARRGLLYAGTEGGVYVSLDDGATWSSMRLDMPGVPIHDLVVKDGDLVAATHGRGFWVLDDLSPLHQVSQPVLDSTAHLFQPRPTVRFQIEASFYPEADSGPSKQYWLSLGQPATFYVEATPEGGSVRRFLDAASNPPDGVGVVYYLKDEPDEDITLTFLDSVGKEIRSFSNRTRPDDDDAHRLPARAGTNRFVWDLRYPGARKAPDAAGPQPGTAEPQAPPGTYRARLVVGDQAYEQSFEVLKDPRISATQQDLEAQFELMCQLRDRLSGVHDAVYRVRNIRDQVDAWKRRAQGLSGSDAITEAADSLIQKLTAVEDKPFSDRTCPGRSAETAPSLQLRRLAGRLSDLMAAVGISSAAPNRQSRDVFGQIDGEVEEQMGRLQEVEDEDLGLFDNLLRELELPSIAP